MKIDASRFNLFWANPERYRLREIWKIAPIEPSPDSFAALYTYGRRRGTATHELLDARWKGTDMAAVLQELREGNIGETAIAAGVRLCHAVIKQYPAETYLAHEALFKYQIPDSPHVMTGRIDHILRWMGEAPVWFFEGEYAVTQPPGFLTIGDWKTSKKRTKKDMEARKQAYANSAQVPFYLLGAKTLGFDTNKFLYRILEDRGKTEKPTIHEVWTERSGLQLQSFARYVHMTCELIEELKHTFGIVNPWPCLYEPFENCPAYGYGSQLGRKMYEGFMPDGFEPKVEHLETMDDYEGEEPDGPA